MSDITQFIRDTLKDIKTDLRDVKSEVQGVRQEAKKERQAIRDRQDAWEDSYNKDRGTWAKLVKEEMKGYVKTSTFNAHKIIFAILIALSGGANIAVLLKDFDTVSSLIAIIIGAL